MNTNNYTGIVIEESLENNFILKKINISDTEVESVNEKHKTPWIDQWTLHTVDVDSSDADNIAKEISKVLDSEHDWYADFKNDKIHYIIFKNKVFKIDRSKKEEYNQATKYGISLGIPDYQVDFSPHIKGWER